MVAAHAVYECNDCMIELSEDALTSQRREEVYEPLVHHRIITYIVELKPAMGRIVCCGIKVIGPYY